MAKKFTSNTLHDEDIDKLFCISGKKYGLKKLLLKAVAIRESSLNERAYRYEPGFWNRYLANNPEWKDKNPAEVSASYGLMQLMYPTAWMLGYRGDGEGLYNPAVNINLGASFIRRLLDDVLKGKSYETFYWLAPVEIALARYNGGRTGNPSVDGKLRTGKYVARVMETWESLREKEKDCTED